MNREQVIFMCPYILSDFRSKSFAAFRLKDGLNYLQFLNLPEVKTARGRLNIPTEFKEIVVVQLPAHNKSPVKQSVKPIMEVILSADSILNPPVVTVKSSGKLGGEVKITDLSGQFQNGTEFAQSGGAHTAEEVGSELNSPSHSTRRQVLVN